MIIAVRDLSNNYAKAKEVAATLACFASNIGHDTITIQLANSEGVEDILNREKIHYDRKGTFVEEGIDALFSMAVMNKVSKDDFADSVRSYTKTKRCDVAAVSRKADFLKMMYNQSTEVETILRSADDAYDYVFLTVDAPSLEDVFGEQTPEVERLIGITAWTVRQGERREMKPSKHMDDEIFILTSFDPRSEFTPKVMRTMLDAGKKPVLGLCNPIAYRDAIDSGKLAAFIRKYKSADEELCSDLASWAMSVRDILANFMKPVKPEPDVWELMDEEEEAPAEMGNKAPAGETFRPTPCGEVISTHTDSQSQEARYEHDT